MANPFAKKKLEGVFAPPQVRPEAPVEIEEPEEVEEEEEGSELLEQTQVLYSNGNTCSSCGYFQEEGGDCAKVRGPIQGLGWCILYKAEAPEMEALPDEG